MSLSYRAALFGLGVCGLIWTLPAQVLAGKKPTLTLGQAHKGSRITLTADKLRYRPARGKIVLAGKVSLKVGKLALVARKVTVSLDARGRPTRVEARGAVSFTRGPSKGSAEAATMLLGPRTRRLALEGKPRLRWAPLGLTLEAHRVEVDLITGRLEVQKVKACLDQGTGGVGSVARKR